MHGALAGGGTTVVTSRTLASSKVTGDPAERARPAPQIASLAEAPNLPHPQPRFLNAGPSAIRTAVLLPSWHQHGTKLPVLLDPYGGPGAQRVIKAATMYLAPQWFAEQGFAVVVADGRGTPGRGPAWDHDRRGLRHRCARGPGHGAARGGRGVHRP